MSLPKKIKRVGLGLAVGLVVMASGGLGLSSASAVTSGQMEATNFVVTSPRCGEVQFSWDYVGGPDDWFIDRDALNNGPTVATGSVAAATGTVTGIVVTGQPAGDNEYALYGSRGGLPAAERVIVTVAACPIETHKVFVCKVVGGPGHYSLKEGKQPIEVDVSALGADVQPVVGAPFSDAQPSFVVASDDRTLCEAGLPPTDDDTTVTPTAPTSVDTCGVANDAYTVPSKDGVVYKVNGEIKTAGPHQGTDKVTITAYAVSDTTVLEGQTSWTFEFTNLPCQSDPVIAPKASLSSECEILDGEKSGLTVVNAVLGSASSDGDSFEVAETIDGVTVFYYIPVAAGEEITPQVFYSAEDGKTVSLVINARDVALASLSFNTAGCAATVTPPPLPLMKVCPQGTKWVDVNHNNTVDKGECKTPVTHKPAVKLVKAATASDNSVPPADTGWEAHQDQGGTTSPWLMVFTLLGGVALLTVAAAKSRRQGAHRD